MLRKLFSSILIGVLCLTLVSGCAANNRDSSSKEKTEGEQIVKETEPKQPEENKEPVSLKFLAYIAGDEYIEAYTKVTEQYNETNTQNAKVDIEFVPWSNYFDKLMTDTMSGNAPDVALFQILWLPTFNANKSLEPLDEYLNTFAGKDDLQDNIVDIFRNVSEDGKLYFIPTELVNHVLYYRKDMFEKAGVKPPETMDEFLDAAKKLTIDIDNDGEIDQYGYAMRGNANGQGGWFCFALANMKEPTFYDSNGNLIAFRDPDVIEGNQFFIDLYRKHKVVPNTAINDGTSEQRAYLISGKAAMMTHHLGSYTALKKELSDKLGVLPIPKGKNSKRFSIIEEGCAVIFSSSEHKSVAFDFLSSYLTKENHKLFVDLKLTVPFLKSVSSDPAVNNDEILKVSYEQLADGKLTPITPYTAQWTSADWPTITAKALLGEIDSKKMLEEMEDVLLGKK